MRLSFGKIFSIIDQVKTKLKGHQKKITGLAFSQTMDVLVSSGADAQVGNVNSQPSGLFNHLTMWMDRMS